MGKRRSNKIKSQVEKVDKKVYPTNKIIGYLSLSAAVIGLLALVLSIDFQGSKSNVTGSAISVEYYGLASYPPLSTHKGEIQTLVSFTRPTLLEMREDNPRAQIAKDIVDHADFTEEILSLYLAENYVHPDDRDELREIISQELMNFRENTFCLKKIAYRLTRDELGVIITSELKKRTCDLDEEVYYMKHSFWNTNEDFICTQDNPALFVLNTNNGKINTDISTC